MTTRTTKSKNSSNKLSSEQIRILESLPGWRWDKSLVEKETGKKKSPEKKKKFASYEEAKKWAQKNNIKTSRQWIDSEKPDNIPIRPDRHYKGKGWINWATCLENGKFVNREWASYEEAQQYAREKGIKTSRQWAQDKNRPINIPSRPDRVYKYKKEHNYKNSILLTGFNINFKSFENAQELSKPFKK
jgi:hypothetical protein